MAGGTRATETPGRGHDQRGAAPDRGDHNTGDGFHDDVGVARYVVSGQKVPVEPLLIGAERAREKREADQPLDTDEA